MRIARLDTFALSGRGEQGAYGAPYGVVVRVTTDNGIVGYGETDSMPGVVKAVIEAPFLHEMMSGLKWVLLDQDPRPDSLQQRPGLAAVVGGERDHHDASLAEALKRAEPGRQLALTAVDHDQIWQRRKAWVVVLVVR